MKSLLPVVLALLPGPALAYVGPGAGLGAVGVVVAILATLALAVIGFLWYPMKRLLARRRSPPVDPERRP